MTPFNRNICIGQKVKLISFNAKTDPPVEVYPHENYWKLIGFQGIVVEGIEREKEYFNDSGRVCVRLNADVSEMGLECHNEAMDALWINERDLELI
jgi:hypothetical protein